MAEEHGFQATEGHCLCTNNCGFFGNPTTQNLCSKCYGDLCLETQNNSKSSDSPLFLSPPTVAPSSSVVENRPTSSSLQKVSCGGATDGTTPAQQVLYMQKECGINQFQVGSGGGRDVADLERRRNREELIISSGIRAGSSGRVLPPFRSVGFLVVVVGE
ncbi:zinc finger A20 and AN1 domain-containing stress-associated protein 4-like [Forsythia ovata]|uniref:Zinc finger A20 and AN1 domain-containing stress-associated protein 4-like n=1 Tax=Forsythia ovata TaxID=205694 RepID=A0ABD1WUD7_9LAMI